MNLYIAPWRHQLAHTSTFYGTCSQLYFLLPALETSMKRKVKGWRILNWTSVHFWLAELKVEAKAGFGFCSQCVLPNEIFPIIRLGRLIQSRNPWSKRRFVEQIDLYLVAIKFSIWRRAYTFLHCIYYSTIIVKLDAMLESIIVMSSTPYGHTVEHIVKGWSNDIIFTSRLMKFRFMLSYIKTYLCSVTESLNTAVGHCSLLIRVR